jgi:polysaccharide biosynthesis/export protein
MILMKFLRIVFLISFPVYFISCGTQKKATPYYLDKVTDTVYKGQIVIPELRIQKNDLLSIQVYSLSTDPKADILYNFPGGSVSAGGSTGASSGGGGYLVDVRGNIEYPRLGTIHAEGLTKQQLADSIKRRLTYPTVLLTDPSVIIRFQNFKILVLGQVGREGLVEVPGEKLTLIEAIGLAGGINDYGKKDKVKIMRETDGRREIGYVSLLSDSLFTSPYYNLVQNDVVFVEPTGRKEKEASDARTFAKISFALTIVTVAATLYNIFK